MQENTCKLYHHHHPVPMAATPINMNRNLSFNSIDSINNNNEGNNDTKNIINIIIMEK